MKKCKLTLSGKHIYREFQDEIVGYEHINGSPFDSTTIYSYIKKCIACGMVDDRKKKCKNNTK